MHRLARGADVFLTNFIGTQLAKYELEYDRLKELNPRLIYAHISGYGTEGPEVQRRAFDATAWWARSGLMEFIRGQGVDPVTSAPGMGDQATSMSLFAAIMTGLYRREKPGEGALVSTSLIANGVWSNGMALQGVLEGMDVGKRKQEHGVHNPFGHVYRTSDGHYVLFVMIHAEREWPRLAAAMGHSEWTGDPRFVDMPTLITNRLELIDLIQEVIGSMTVDQTLATLDKHEITYGHVRPMGQVVDDPQLAANDIIVDTNDPGEDYDRTIMSPIRIREEPKRPPQRAPDIGAQTREVLTELGIDEVEIDQLIANGAAGETITHDTNDP